MDTQIHQYVAVKPFKFAGKEYGRGDVFDGDATGEQMRKLINVRRLELAAVAKQRQNKGWKRRKG